LISSEAGVLKRARERFLSRVQKVDGHWLWLGYIDQDGYGRFAFNYSRATAHRAAYKLFKGPIPDDYDADHVCEFRNCVNPKHIIATPRDVNRGKP